MTPMDRTEALPPGGAQRRELLGIAGLAAASLVAARADAQARAGTTGSLEEAAVYAIPRTWEELSSELQLRTDRQIYPMAGMRSEDVRAILQRIGSLDRSAWGREWARTAQAFIDKGDALANGDPKAAAEAYILGWRYAAFGGWPVALVPEKRVSYALSLKAFGKYARLQPQPIERIELPFDGGSIAFYLQIPAHSAPVPAVISIGGLDSYKEYVADHYGPVYMGLGIAIVAVDAPNTGETKIRADERGERIYSAVIDYLRTRQEIDAARIGVQGVSLGGYWATKVAFREAKRLRFAVNWGGPLDQSWSADQMRQALMSREYLFDLPQAQMAVWGRATPTDLIAQQHRLSIVEQGLADRPTPPMLLVGGLKDTLVPAEDTLLLMRHGTPKSAWINPEGLHVGRSREWPDERILREVIAPWIVNQVAV